MSQENQKDITKIITESRKLIKLNNYNKIHTERVSKYRVYALFQFFSTTAIFLISLALGLTVYIGLEGQSKLDHNFFKDAFISVISFDATESLNIFIAIAAYCSFFFWLISIVTALMQTKNKQKSIFDLAFLLFFFIPLLSNVITLFCQMSEVFYKTPSDFVDKYKTKLDYLEELEKYVGKEKNISRKKVKK